MADQEKAAAETETKKEAETEAPADKGIKLHVKSLEESMTSEALTALFAPHGTVKKGEVKVTAEGKSKGFGQVIMSTQEEATKAIAALNGSKQGEKEISVAIAEQKPKADAKAKPKAKGAGEKGKGKGKGDKKGGKAQAQGASPPWLNYGYPMMGYDQSYFDPVQYQLLQQQMMTMQLLQAQAVSAAPVPPAATNTGGKSKGKGKGGGNAKDKGTKVEGTFTGKLKSINFREDKGYGFIACEDIHKKYNRDVYVAADQLPQGTKQGDQFEFGVTLDAKGQVRATNVVSKP